MIDLSIVNQKYITPINKPQRNQPFIYFICIDVENRKDGSFINAAFSGEYKEKKTGKVKEFFHYSDTYEDFINTITVELKDYTFNYCFYNLSYDEAFLLDIVDSSKSLRAGSRVIQLELYEKYGGQKVWDIQNISGIEYKLEDWIQYLEMEKYFGVRKESLFDKRLRVINDTKATDILARFIRDFFVNKLGSKLKYTIGSCALELFKRKYLKYRIKRDYLFVYISEMDYLNSLTLYGIKLMSANDDVLYYDINPIDVIERKAYHGGRNEIVKRGKILVESYDVSSMYLSCLKYDYPNPESAIYITESLINKLSKGWRYYYENYLSILDVEVEIPDMILAPLPFKNDDTINIEYPTGKFRGVFTNVELINAEKYGVKIIKVYEMVYYLRKEKYFVEFMNDIWQQRLVHKSQCGNTDFDNLKCLECLGSKQCDKYIPNPNYNKPMEIALKKVGNSLVGKFGQKNPIVAYYGKEKDMSVELRDEIFDDGKAFTPHILNGELYISYASDKEIDSKFAFVCWASFTTAYARIKLYNEAKKFESEVVYMDTDSIKKIKTDNHLENSKQLGMFGLEYTQEEIFYSCKNYGDKTKGVPRGKLKKSKVCPKGQLIVHFDDLNVRSFIRLDDENLGIKIFEFERPFKLKEAIRRGKVVSSWELKTKVVTMKDDKRVWFGDVFYNQGISSLPKKYILC